MYLIMLPEQSAPEAAEDLHISLQWMITLFTGAWLSIFSCSWNVTFKSNASVVKAAVWYFIAWVLISVGAAALQGLYKTPIYDFFMGMMGEGAGMTVADIITMLINCVISFWVFFPIMKIIFKEKKHKNRELLQSGNNSFF